MGNKPSQPHRLSTSASARLVGERVRRQEVLYQPGRQSQLYLGEAAESLAGEQRINDRSGPAWPETFRESGLTAQ
jgi:hypothetical protein